MFSGQAQRSGQYFGSFLLSSSLRPGERQTRAPGTPAGGSSLSRESEGGAARSSGPHIPQRRVRSSSANSESPEVPSEPVGSAPAPASASTSRSRAVRPPSAATEFRLWQTCVCCTRPSGERGHPSRLPRRDATAITSCLTDDAATRRGQETQTDAATQSRRDRDSGIELGGGCRRRTPPVTSSRDSRASAAAAPGARATRRRPAHRDARL